MLQTAKAPARAGSAGWLVPAGLLLLGSLPIVAGALRLDAAVRRRGDHARQPALRRAAPAGRPAHRERRVSFPSLAHSSSPPASGGEAPAGIAWPGGCLFHSG